MDQFTVQLYIYIASFLKVPDLVQWTPDGNFYLVVTGKQAEIYDVKVKYFPQVHIVQMEIFMVCARYNTAMLAEQFVYITFLHHVCTVSCVRVHQKYQFRGNKCTYSYRGSCLSAICVM